MRSSNFLSDAKSYDAVKPTDFKAIDSPAVNTFKLKKIVLVVNGDKNNSYSYDLGEGNPKDQINKILNGFIAYQKSKGVRLTKKDIEVYTQNPTPTITNNKLDTSNPLPTAKEKILTSLYDTTNLRDIKTLKAKGTITLGTVRQLVSAGKVKAKDNANFKKQQPLLDSLLSNFINNPGKKNFPVTAINDMSTLKKKYGFQSAAEIAKDFGEILGPVGLLTDNLNGNAQRMALSFLGAKNYAELKDATIHFNGDKTSMLVDSYVEYKGNILSISSKANGAQGASFNGLFSAINEVKRSPEAAKLFNKEILGNPKFKQAYELLQMLGGDSDSEGWATKFVILEKLGTIPKSDLALTQQLLAKYKTSAGMEKSASAELDALLTSKGYSKQLQGIYKKFTTDTKVAAKKGTWVRLLKAMINAIGKQVNTMPEFSQVCTWIFNHGAIITIVTETSDPKEKGSAPLIINNIKGTWPSQAVETVELLEDPASLQLGFRLWVNGHQKQFGKNSTSASLSNPTVGTVSAADQTAMRAHTPQDLARDANSWAAAGKYNTGTMKGPDGAQTLPAQQQVSKGQEYNIAGQGWTDADLIAQGAPDSLIKKVQAARRELVNYAANPAKKAEFTRVAKAEQERFDKLHTLNKLGGNKGPQGYNGYAIVNGVNNLQKIAQDPAQKQRWQQVVKDAGL